jgi:hypothetical protein
MSSELSHAYARQNTSSAVFELERYATTAVASTTLAFRVTVALRSLTNLV